MYGYQYQAPGRRCTGKVQAGTSRLQRYLVTTYDAVDFVDDISDSGTYACRNVRGGSGLSTHAEGRAGDDRTHREEGDKLAADLVQRAPLLGMQEVIWWRRRWDSISRQWKSYTGQNPHTDHVHWSLCWPAATGLTDAEIISSFGQAAPVPEEDTDMAPKMVKRTGSTKLYAVIGGKALPMGSGDQIARLKAAGFVRDVDAGEQDFEEFPANEFDFYFPGVAGP